MRPLAALLIGVLIFSRPASAEWVLSAYTGVSHTFPTDLRVRRPGSNSDATFENVSWAPHPFTQRAPYYGLRISYFRSTSPHAGTLIDYTHYKMYAETVEQVQVHGKWRGLPVNERTYLGSRVQHLEISHGVNLTSIDAQYRWGSTFEGKQRWETHLGAGVLVYLPHAEGMVDGVGVEGDYQYGGVGGQIFGGTEYRVWRHVGLLVEGKFDLGKLDVNLDPDTRVALQVRTLHLLGGISFHF